MERQTQARGKYVHERERNRTAWITRHDARLRSLSSKLRKPAQQSPTFPKFLRVKAQVRDSKERGGRGTLMLISGCEYSVAAKLFPMDLVNFRFRIARFPYLTSRDTFGLSQPANFTGL